MRVAKAKGRLPASSPSSMSGRKPHLFALHRAGEHSVAELGDLFGVTRSTVYRAIQRDAVRQRGPARTFLARRHCLVEDRL